MMSLKSNWYSFSKFALLPLLYAVLSLTCIAQTAPIYKPITGEQRLHRYLKEAYLSPIPYVAALAAGGISQFENEPPEWRQGFEAYAKRAGSSFGRFAINSTVRASGAALLGYDPRYTRCTCTGFAPRLGHSILWSFITYNNDGKKRLDIPAIAGPYAGGMISMYWYPSRFDPVKDGFREGTRTMSFSIGRNVFREFAPDLKRAFHHKQ